MAPLRLTRLARSIIDDIGNTGKDLTDKAGGAADKAKELGDTVGQAQDALATYNKLKDQVTGYYQWYLDHKPLIYFILACIAGIILMCLLQCAFQWLKCWTNSCCFCINVGRWCGRKATDEKSRMCCKSCFLRCGACCVATDKCRVGRHAAAEAAEKRLVAYSGIDTSYLTRCGGPVEDDPEKAQAQRLGPWINDKVGCTLVPGKWGRVKKIADLQKEVRESKKIIDDIRDALGPERRQKFLGGIRYLQEAADKAEQAIGGAARKASSRTHSVSSGKSRSGKRGRKRDSQGS